MGQPSRVDHEAGAPDGGEFFTPREVFRLLRLGNTKGYAMLAAGDFPFPIVKLGREYRISRHAYYQVMHGGADTSDARVA